VALLCERLDAAIAVKRFLKPRGISARRTQGRDRSRNPAPLNAPRVRAQTPSRHSAPRRIGRAFPMLHPCCGGVMSRPTHRQFRRDDISCRRLANVSMPVIPLGAQCGDGGPECVVASRWDCTLESLEGINRQRRSSWPAAWCAASPTRTARFSRK
jgi:hypothetical protein